MATRTRADLGSFEDIAAAAVRTTGLDDFGGTEHEEGLRLLCEDLVAHGGLTPEGNYMQRTQIKSALVARLLSQRGFAQHPSYAEVAIRRPIFVCGLPRTGTTALHRLLHADPTHQGLELWLTEVPAPRPPRASWDEDPVFQALNAAYSEHQVLNPEFMGIHYMDAATVEECWRVLRQSGTSIGFESLAYVPDYSAWLAKQDWTPAYERHRANLQLIGLHDQDQRWVLKNPSHLVALDAILTVYPDALIVQTHRDPVVAIASACSLSAEATRGWSTTFVGATIGRTQLDMLGNAVARFNEQRAQHPAAQFVDVDYREFVGDPVRTTRKIYDAFDLDWTPATDRAVRALDEESRQGGRRPAHSYDLADYGLSEAEVRERFPGVRP
ncbi:MAG: sulfotransferase [Marmoricola sp.]